MKQLTLLCAATRTEAKACQRGIDDSGHAESFEICVSGMGMTRAARALTERLDRAGAPKPIRVISTGFAGSSVAGVSVGSWIVGRSVSVEGLPALKLECSKLEKALQATELPCRGVDVTSQKKVLSFARETPAPITVDMESFSLAEIARARGIEFQIFRMVSDTPAHPIPEAIASFASVGLAEGRGEIASRAIRGAGQAMSHPIRFAEFLTRGARLPRMLSQGWKVAAPCF